MNEASNFLRVSFINRENGKDRNPIYEGKIQYYNR